MPILNEMRIVEKAGNFFKNGSFEKAAKNAVYAAVIGTWGADTSMDVRYAAKKDRKNVFINDVLIGAAMVVGAIAGRAGIEKFLNRKVIQGAKKIVEETLSPAKGYLWALSIPVGAGLFGGVAGEIAQKFFPVKNDKPEKVLEKANNLITSKFGPIDKISKFPADELAKEVNPSFSTMVGFAVGKEKGIKNKVKKFIFEIISGVLVPFTLLLPVTSYLTKRFPESPGKIKLITIGLGVSASFAGKAAGKWFDKKVTDKIIEHKFWEEIAAKQRELIKSSMFTDNPFEKQQIHQQLKNIKDFKKKAKDSGSSVPELIANSTDQNQVITKNS